MDGILSYHMNPLTCGVARFNRALSEKTGLPMHQMFSPEAARCRRPLLSIKLSEFSGDDPARLSSMIDGWRPDVEPRLFLHGYMATPVEVKLLRRATTIYCGNEALASELSSLHDNVVDAWCPGFLFDATPFPEQVDISVYTFGMAHKVRADYYHGLHDLLEKSNKSYCLYISAAIHEGSSLDDSFTAAYEDLKTIFGDRIFFLGFISDTALYNYLTKCTFFAAFFDGGVRANNTSVNTAMQCGAVVLTNLDEHSPTDFNHLQSVIDVRQCRDELPLDAELLNRIAERGRVVAAGRGWDPLIDLFRGRENFSS